MSRSIGLLPLTRSLHSLFSGPSPLLIASRAVLLATVVASVLAACAGERNVAVRVSVPGADSLESPAAGIGIVALPYDRDSVLASLEARARTPRPHAAALDSLFARFRGPFTLYTSISYTAGRLRDSLSLLRRRLDSLPHDAQYRTMRADAAQLSDSLEAIESRARRARGALDRARAEFVDRSESLRAAVRQWEDSTYQGYDSLVENLVKSSGRAAATDSTDQTGWAHFSLAPGRWWLYARAWDTSDPNAEWYWNVPVEEDTVLLSSRTGKRRPRY